MHRYGDDGSATGYDMWRRRRSWAAGSRGLEGYAAYLSGAEDDDAWSAIVGADIAAYKTSSSTAPQAVVVGVATGVLTFLVNRWLGKVLG